MTIRYFKNELKHSKRFDHVADDVMPLFWSWKKHTTKTSNMLFDFSKIQLVVYYECCVLIG